MNVNAVRRDLEERVGVTVFFDEGISDYKIQQIGEDIKQLEHVTSVTFTSAEEAWSEYQKEYFDSTPELAEGFKDNPLANSASYTVLVDKIENQDTVVAAIQDIVGVRQVNQSSGAANTLKSFNRLFTYVSIGVIAILLVIAVILISNTINVGISVRKDEIAIMKLIGATDSFVRAPFVVEGFVLGLIGSLIPLAILYVSYGWLLSKILSRFGALSEMGDVLLTVNQVFFYLLPVGLILGVVSVLSARSLQ
jgi:cell division transport system permease protein